MMSWQLTMYGFLHMSMQIRVALSTAIYRKVLRLSRSAQETANIGHVINLVSGDVGRFENSLVMAQFFFTTPFLLIVCGYALWAELGLAAFAGIGAILLMAPIQCRYCYWLFMCHVHRKIRCILNPIKLIYFRCVRFVHGDDTGNSRRSNGQSSQTHE